VTICKVALDETVPYLKRVKKKKAVPKDKQHQKHFLNMKLRNEDMIIVSYSEINVNNQIKQFFDKLGKSRVEVYEGFEKVGIVSLFKRVFRILMERVSQIREIVRSDGNVGAGRAVRPAAGRRVGCGRTKDAGNIDLARRHRIIGEPFGAKDAAGSVGDVADGPAIAVRLLPLEFEVRRGRARRRGGAQAGPPPLRRSRGITRLLRTAADLQDRVAIGGRKLNFKGASAGTELGLHDFGGRRLGPDASKKVRPDSKIRMAARARHNERSG
jgi:hypothetical protein